MNQKSGSFINSHSAWLHAIVLVNISQITANSLDVFACLFLLRCLQIVLKHTGLLFSDLLKSIDKTIGYVDLWPGTLFAEQLVPGCT